MIKQKSFVKKSIFAWIIIISIVTGLFSGSVAPLPVSAASNMVGNVDMNGDPSFDSDSVSNSARTQYRWLSYPGARFTMNHSLWDSPIRSNLQLDLAGYAYNSTIGIQNVVSVKMAPTNGIGKEAGKADSTWYPYKKSFNAGGYESLSGVSISGYDFFTDANASIARVMQINGSAGKDLLLSGKVNGTGAVWDGTNKVLVIEGAINREDPANSALGKYYYALRFVSLSGNELATTDVDQVPVTNGTDDWSLKIPVGTADGSYYGVGFGFATEVEGKQAAIDRAKGCFKDGAAAALANTKNVFDGYLRKVPAPKDFGISSDIPAYGVNPEQHRKAYYGAWTFMLNNMMDVLPENNTDVKNFDYPQVLCGKPSLWAAGGSYNRGSCAWESYFGQMFLSYINDPRYSWNAFKGIMSMVDDKGYLQGEVLPSVKAQTAWNLYKRGGCTKEELTAMYPVLKKYLNWLEQNPRWIYGLHNDSSEKDIEFCTSLVFDCDYAINIAKEIGQSGDVTMWEQKKQSMTQNIKTWFLSSPQKLYHYYFTDWQTNTSRYEDGHYYGDRFSDNPLSIMMAMMCDDLTETDYSRLMNYFNRGFDTSEGTGGFSGYKYPLAAITTYGMLKHGYLSEARQYMNVIIRDTIRLGNFTEAITSTPATDGVTPSTFSAAGMIDFTLMLNGCDTHTGTPTQLDWSNTPVHEEEAYVNLALNKPATVSSVEDSTLIGSGAMDGDLKTRWASQHSDPQWIYVDLGTVQSISKVRLQWESAYGKSYKIQVSNDTVNWTDVYSTVNGDGGLDEIYFRPTDARYVRMYGTQRGTGGGYSLWEFEVYNDPNLAVGTNVKVSSGEENAAAAVDGDFKTAWSTQSDDPQWIYVDLGSEQYIDRVKLKWQEAYASSYSIMISDDEKNWTSVYSSAKGTGGSDDISFAPVTARYVRINAEEKGTTALSGYSLSEFAVYRVPLSKIEGEVSSEQITAKILKNTLPDLPKQITVTYSDGKVVQKYPASVTWDSMNASDFDIPGMKTVNGTIDFNGQKVTASVEVVDPQIKSLTGKYEVEQYKTLSFKVVNGQNDVSNVVWSIKEPGYDAAAGISGTGILQAVKPGAVTVVARLPEYGVTLEKEITIIPKNAVSFAFGGTATASGSMDDAQNPGKAIDENSSTVWRCNNNDGYFAFTLELKKAVSPTGIMLQWVAETQPKTYDIYFSEDGNNWEKVKTVTTPDTGKNVYKDIQIFEDKKETKYIRINATGSSNYIPGIIEFQVFADPEITTSVSGIDITSATGNFEITGKGAALQLNAVVTPAGATDDRVEWSVATAEGGITTLADISSTGVLAPLGNGTVKVTARSMSNPEISVSQEVVISGQTLANVALNKSASAQRYDYSVPKDAIDGNLSTTFKTGEVGNNSGNPLNLTVDLQDQYNISAAKLYFGGTQPIDFVLQYSNDNSNWSDIPGTNKAGNNDKDYTVAFNTVNARYIRIWVTKLNGNGWGFEVNEFEVYGENKTVLTPTDNLSVSAIVGTAPVLPSQVECKNTSGDAIQADVTWKPIDPSKYAVAGSFRADGNLTDGTPVYLIVYVKPVIYFDLNGGEGQTPEKMLMNVGQQVGTLSVPASETREFFDWNTRPDGEGDTYTADTVYDFHGNTTLYAVWRWKAPAQPAIAEQTGDTVSVTLTVSPLTGWEYAVVTKDAALQNSDWKASNIFTGLHPAADYDVYTRHRETAGTRASEASPKLTVTTVKLTQTAPKVEYTKQGDWETEGVTVTITSPTTGATYSIDNFATTVSSPISFPAGTTSAAIYIRSEETATQNQSAVTTLELDFRKQDQAAPNVALNAVSDESSVTLTVGASGGQTGGYEYRIDDEAAYTDLPADGKITDLTPGKLINLFVRDKGNMEYNPSPDATAAITLPKYKNSATVAMTEADFNVTETGIKMITAPAATSGSAIEYSFDGGEYILLDSGSLPDFRDLEPGSSHTISVRAAGDATHEAGTATTLTIATASPKSGSADITSVVSPSGAQIRGTNINANVSNGTASLTLNVNVSEKASWKLYGDSTCTTEIPDRTLSLSVGANTAYIKVAAENGTTKVYTITVSRASANTGGGNTGSSSGNTSTASDVTGSTIAPQAAVSNGITTAKPSDASVKKALENAQNETKATGKASEVIVAVPAQNNTSAVAITVPKNSFEEIERSPGTLLTAKAGDVIVTFSDPAIAEINRTAKGDIVITAGKADTSKLTEEQKKEVKDRPVYSFTVTSGDVTHTAFKGNVKVSMPYTLKPGENPNAIVVYYVDGKGNLQIVESSVYDLATGRVTFTTTHFSVYMIGSNPVGFTDVKDHWGKPAIEFAAARGLVEGVGNGLYQPDRKITRAEFVQMMQNVLKLSDENNTAGYSDVAAGKWYYKAIMAAKAAGLLKGIKLNGNSFKPNQAITREEMAVILANTAVYKKLNVPSGDLDLSAKFKDYKSINSDYRDEIQTVVKLGLMNGVGADTFDPKGVTTRAQAAQVQMNLLQQLN